MPVSGSKQSFAFADQFGYIFRIHFLKQAFAVGLYRVYAEILSPCMRYVNTSFSRSDKVR